MGGSLARCRRRSREGHCTLFAQLSERVCAYLVRRPEAGVPHYPGLAAKGLKSGGFAGAGKLSALAGVRRALKQYRCGR